MKFTPAIALAIASFGFNTVSAAVAAHPTDAAPHQGLTASGDLPYPERLPIFHGVIDGHAYEIKARTWDDVVANLTATYPGINMENDGNPPVDVDAILSASKAKGEAAQNGVVARGKIYPIACFNRKDWGPAYWHPAEDACRKVLATKGSVAIFAKSCIRLACSEIDSYWPAGVWVCNDNDYRIDPNTNYLGTYAADTIYACKKDVTPWFGIGRTYVTQGQFFDTDRYNVIVKEIKRYTGTKSTCGDSRGFPLD